MDVLSAPPLGRRLDFQDSLLLCFKQEVRDKNRFRVSSKCAIVGPAIEADSIALLWYFYDFVRVSRGNRRLNRGDTSARALMARLAYHTARAVCSLPRPRRVSCPTLRTLCAVWININNTRQDLGSLMTQNLPVHHRWLLVAAIAVGFLAFAAVFLVLTGIIAEPETVIENIVRALLGQ